ncbi:MAG: hypothetical protein ACKVII_28305 [Planctomycetales bacterium]|jgi:hypothetical protein
MSNSDTLAPATSNIPTYARVLPIVSLCSSILFAVTSVVTWIALLAISSYNILVALFIGLPASLWGSLLLAFLPTAVLRIFLNDQRLKWSLWISGSAAAINAGVCVFITAMC